MKSSQPFNGLLSTSQTMGNMSNLNEVIASMARGGSNRREPIPKCNTGKSPLLGTHNGKAIYLLFNGVPGDKRQNGGNILTNAVSKSFVPHHGPRIVYGEGCWIGATRLKSMGVVFKQVP